MSTTLIERVSLLDSVLNKKEKFSENVTDNLLKSFNIKNAENILDIEGSERLSHINLIIKDGVRNIEELAMKLASDVNISYDAALSEVRELRENHRLGYFVSGLVESRFPIYYFVEWDGTEPAFEECKTLRKSKARYFRELYKHSKKVGRPSNKG